MYIYLYMLVCFNGRGKLMCMHIKQIIFFFFQLWRFQFPTVIPRETLLILIPNNIYESEEKKQENDCRFLVSFPFKKWVILILCSPINNWLNDWLNSVLSLSAIFQPYNNSTYKRGQLCFHFLCTKPKDIKTMACNQKKDVLHIMHK